MSKAQKGLKSILLDFSSLAKFQIRYIFFFRIFRKNLFFFDLIQNSIGYIFSQQQQDLVEYEVEPPLKKPKMEPVDVDADTSSGHLDELSVTDDSLVCFPSHRISKLAVRNPLIPFLALRSLDYGQ